MCTSQGLLSKAHDEPLYVSTMPTAYNAVLREAPLECQTIVCSAKLYNQRLATLSTYHQLTPMSRRHHIHAVGGRSGAMLYKPVFLPLQTLYSDSV